MLGLHCDLVQISLFLLFSSSSSPLFESTGNIPKESSLFTYDSKYLLDSYRFQSNHSSAFVPVFSLPDIPDDALVEDMMKICCGEGAQFCRYDTLTTRSITMGNATLRAYSDHRALLEALQPGTKPWSHVCICLSLS